MLSKKLKIINKLGLHARASMKFSDLAARFQSEIIIRYRNQEADAKSILNVMMLGISKDAEIELLTAGDDETEAMHALETLIGDRFGESE